MEQEWLGHQHSIESQRSDPPNNIQLHVRWREVSPAGCQDILENRTGLRIPPWRTPLEIPKYPEALPDH